MLSNILKLRCGALTFTSCKAFPKNKKKFGSSLPRSFSAWFLKKKSLMLYILYQMPKLHCLIAFTSWGPEKYIYCNYFFPILHVISFKIELSLIYQAFFLHDQKSQDKNLNIYNLTFNEISLKQRKKFYFERWESDFNIKLNPMVWFLAVKLLSRPT